MRRAGCRTEGAPFAICPRNDGSEISWLLLGTLSNQRTKWIGSVSWALGPSGKETSRETMECR